MSWMHHSAFRLLSLVLLVLCVVLGPVTGKPSCLHLRVHCVSPRRLFSAPGARQTPSVRPGLLIMCFFPFFAARTQPFGPANPVLARRGHLVTADSTSTASFAGAVSVAPSASTLESASSEAVISTGLLTAPKASSTARGSSAKPNGDSDASSARSSTAAAPATVVASATDSAQGVDASQEAAIQSQSQVDSSSVSGSTKTGAAGLMGVGWGAVVAGVLAGTLVLA